MWHVGCTTEIQQSGGSTVQREAAADVDTVHESPWHKGTCKGNLFFCLSLLLILLECSMRSWRISIQNFLFSCQWQILVFIWWSYSPFIICLSARLIDWFLHIVVWLIFRFLLSFRCNKKAKSEISYFSAPFRYCCQWRASGTKSSAGEENLGRFFRGAFGECPVLGVAAGRTGKSAACCGKEEQKFRRQVGRWYGSNLISSGNYRELLFLQDYCNQSIEQSWYWTHELSFEFR